VKNSISILLLLVLSVLFNQSLLAQDYRVAVRAHNGVEHAFTQWQETLNALSKAIPEHSFKLVPIISLKEITLAAERGEFDFILTNPSSYVELNILHDARVLVTLNNKRADTAQSRFGSVIFTHAGNDHILSIQDLKNTTVMAVSEPAFGGWRVAWLEMLKHGIDPYKDLKAVKFTNSKTQAEVVNAVRDGIVEVGVVRTDQLERMANSGKADLRYFRILNSKDTPAFPFFHSTELYPEWAFAAMPSVPDSHSQSVKKALQSIQPSSHAARKGQYVGWINPLDYTSAENLMKRLQVGPFFKSR